MDAIAGTWVFAGADGLGDEGFMEGLCPSKPPRQRPGGLWKPGFLVAPEGCFERCHRQGNVVGVQVS